MTPKLGWLEDLRTCSQKADTNATNRKGTFVLKTWAQIGNMDVLSMFHLCFPEKYVINELIPTTNRNIKGVSFMWYWDDVFSWCVSMAFLISASVGVKNQLTCEKGHCFASMTSSETITSLHEQNLSAELMLDITEPIHHTSKIIFMNNGLCVTAGIFAM
ncbi:hypothetical protein ACHAW6_002512 [Cyclotella cf. meneghiniana]